MAAHDETLKMHKEGAMDSRKCGCGCGEEVQGDARYRPGHDLRLGNALREGWERADWFHRTQVVGLLGLDDSLLDTDAPE